MHLVGLLIEVECIHRFFALRSRAHLIRRLFGKKNKEVGNTSYRVVDVELLLYPPTLNRVDLRVSNDLIVKTGLSLQFR